MNKKMIAGLVAAIILFVFTGLVTKFSQEAVQDTFEGFDSTMFSKDVFSELVLPEGRYVAVIDIRGTIEDVGSSDLFNTVEYDHQGILDFVDQITDDSNNVAIFLNIDSPGGYTYQVVEVYEKLAKYKELTGRPIYAYCNSYCCSGGYYIASVADKIYANQESVVGSIGVIMSTYNCAGLYEKIGIKEVNITSGKNKAMGSLGTEMTDEQKGIYQSLVDESYERFVDVVAKERELGRDKVYKLADGRIYTSNQAKEAGLIDEVSNYETFMSFLDSEVGNAEYYTFGQDQNDFYSLLFGSINNLIPKSAVQTNLELLDKYKNGGMMYYAKLD